MLMLTLMLTLMLMGSLPLQGFAARAARAFQVRLAAVGLQSDTEHVRAATHYLTMLAPAASAQPVQAHIRIPAGVAPGEDIQATVGGRNVRVTVPPGFTAGMLLPVMAQQPSAQPTPPPPVRAAIIALAQSVVVVVVVVVVIIVITRLRMSQIAQSSSSS